MLTAIAIIYIIYQLIKSASEDAQMKQWCKNRGYDTYPSNTGMRDVKTNKHCYVDPRTGKKTLW